MARRLDSNTKVSSYIDLDKVAENLLGVSRFDIVDATKRAGSKAPSKALKALFQTKEGLEILRSTQKNSESAKLGLSRIVDNGLIKIYERAMQEEEVIDGNGNATGIFEYDGTLALNALKLSIEHFGLSRKKDDNLNDFGFDDFVNQETVFLTLAQFIDWMLREAISTNISRERMKRKLLRQDFLSDAMIEYKDIVSSREND